MFAAMGRCLEQLINPMGAGAGWSLWGCELQAVRPVQPAVLCLPAQRQRPALRGREHVWGLREGPG